MINVSCGVFGLKKSCSNVDMLAFYSEMYVAYSFDVLFQFSAKEKL